MQDKHFLITHKNEDRSIFINKVKYSKTIFHVGDNPQKGDVLKNPLLTFHTFFCEWVLENYNYLPEYVVVSQAIPDDHVHQPLLAIDSTFTSDFGSLCYARSLYNQYSTNWDNKFSLPLRTVLHELGMGFLNDDNTMKPLYMVYPGEINFISRKRILEKPKSFYEKIINFDSNEKIFNLIDSQKYPHYFYENIKQNFPEYKNLSNKKLLEIFTDRSKFTYKHGLLGICLEALWFILFSSKEQFKTLEKSQAAIGNKFYFNTRKKEYDSNFNFNIYPYYNNPSQSILNLKLMENDWFKWDCPYYLKWRETLVEKTIWEGQQRGFDGKQLLEFYKRVGYKHISL